MHLLKALGELAAQGQPPLGPKHLGQILGTLEQTMRAFIKNNGQSAIHPLLKPFLSLRSEEHTSELQSRGHLVCRLLLEKKNKRRTENTVVVSRKADSINERARRV